MSKAGSAPVGAAQRRSHLALSCSVLLVGLAALLFVVAPGRGAAWIQDDGLFLRMAWDAAHGYGFDQMLPQSPSYLFHALMMRLGMHEYLHFRYLNYLVILLSAGLFFTGLGRGKEDKAWVPMAILASLLVSLNSIQNPNSLSQACFLTGTGLYFHAMQVHGRLPYKLLLVGVGFFFGLAGFMHAAVAVAMVLLVVLLLVWDIKTRRSPLLPVFLVTVTLLWWWYAQEIGLRVLLAQPAGHDASLAQLASRILQILWFYGKAVLLFIALSYYHRRRDAQPIASRDLLDRAFTACALLSALVFLTDSGMRFPGWLGISQLPGAMVFLLYFAWMQWALARYRHEHASLAPRTSQLLAWLKNTEMDGETRKLVFAFSGFILVPSALAVGSNTAIIQGMVFFAGPAWGLLIYLWAQTQGAALRRSEVLLGALWLLIFAVFALGYNHPNYARPLASGKVALQSNPLRGIEETNTYQSAAGQLLQAYQNNDCAHKELLLMDYLPMVYFVLQHPAPVQIGVIRPQMYFPEKKLLDILETSEAWCVLDATGVETQTEIDQLQGQDKRARMRAFIERNADLSVPIAAPSKEILGSMQLYVRAARRPL